MIFKNSDAFNSLTSLANADEHGKLGFIIAKNRRKIESELKEYIAKRDELIKKYGIQEGNGYSLNPIYVNEFLAEMAQYDEIECDIPVMQVDEEIFCSGTLTSKQMYTLDWMIITKED